MHMADKPYTDEDWLRQEYSNKPVSEIANACGVTKATIYRWMRKHGIQTQSKFHKNHAPYRDEKWLQERWYSADSVAKIAEEAGADPSTISEWAQKHGFLSFYDAKPWNDKQRLKKAYVEDKMSIREIANEFGCSSATVWKSLKAHDINRRVGKEAFHAKNPACQHYFHPRGYEIAASEHNGSTDYVAIHRLVAVANGADPHTVFSGNDVHVHHKNGRKFDNRPGNLEVKTNSEHAREHYEELEMKPHEHKEGA